jgi:hypothetical protein
MHHQRHEGDDQHHHHGQLVDQEADLHGQIAAGRPGVHRAIERIAGLNVLEDDADRTKEIATPRMVTVCATRHGRGCWRRRPARMAPASGARGTSR